MSFHVIQRHRVQGKLGVLALLAALSAAGCEATITPQPAAIVYRPPTVEVEVEAVPVDIYARPRVIWNGVWVYLVDGRWYYPTRRGWMVLEEEPRELGRYRTQIEHSRRARPVPYDAHPYERGRERTPR